jgi:pimeloyl-ACP methyl ester carboxylesterase
MAGALVTERFENRGLSLAAYRWGLPSTCPVVLVHGYLDHALSFAPMVSFLPDHLPLVAMDLRGFGASDWIGAGGYYYFYDYLDDLAVFLFEHLGCERVHLVGHSLGGVVVSAFAATFPEQTESLLIMEGLGPNYGAVDQAVVRIQRWLDGLRMHEKRLAVPERKLHRSRIASVEQAAFRLQRINSRLPEWVARCIAETSTEPAEEGSIERVWRHDILHRTQGPRAFLADEAQAFWAGVRAPVLSLNGDESFLNSTDLHARHAFFENVRIGHFSEAGHNLHHERPEAVAEIVAWWTQGGFREPSQTIPGGVREEVSGAP